MIEIYEFIKKELTPFGYKIEKKVVDAKDFGVPQTRKRLLIIMTRTDKKITFPKKEHGEGLKPYKTTSSKSRRTVWKRTYEKNLP